MSEFEEGTSNQTNNYERELDRYRFRNQRFDKEANTHYTYTDSLTLLNNLGDIAEMIKHHKERQVPRLDELDDYYLGDNTEILQRASRRKHNNDADHRATHNFAKYVSQFITGYLAGNPIKLQHEKDTVNDSIQEFNDLSDIDSLNADIVLDLSIYGRAYELTYRNRQDQSRVALSSPLCTFVIYDDTVEKLPVAAVRYWEHKGVTDERLYVDLYTSTQRIRFESKSAGDIVLIEQAREVHYFDGVPINEYANNRFRQGDFENVLNLIDLYDASQSDTANYMTDLNDAMLKIIGNVELNQDEAEKMRESNILFLRTEPSMDGRESKAEADYIYKKYDVAGVESYKGRLQADIHKFTNTPDLNDDHFSGTQSGESMKYKLFGLEQVRAIKERLFKKALLNRYRLLANMSSKAKDAVSLPTDEVDSMEVIFTPNLPKSLKDEIEMFVELGGELSKETAMTLLSLIKDPQLELEKLKEEAQDVETPYDFNGNEDKTPVESGE